jgi:hypothetical protein
METNILCITFSLLAFIASISYQRGQKFILRIKKLSLVSIMSLIISLVFLLAMILNIYQQDMDITHYLIMASLYTYSIGVGIIIIIDQIYVRYKKHK